MAVELHGRRLEADADSIERQLGRAAVAVPGDAQPFHRGARGQALDQFDAARHADILAAVVGLSHAELRDFQLRAIEVDRVGFG